MADVATLFVKPQTGPFSLGLYRQVLDAVVEGKVMTLTVSTGDNERVFFFTRGAILFLATGTSGGEVLARKVLARGLVAKAVLDPLIARANSDVPLLQDVLREAGALDDAAVKSVVEEVLEDHLLELALLEGTLALCDIVPGNPPTRLYDKDVPAIRLSLGAKALIERARQKIADGATRILSGLGGSTRHRAKLSFEAQEALSPAAHAVVSQLSAEPRPIGDVLSACALEGLSAWAAAEQLASLASQKRVAIERVTERSKKEELAQAVKIEDAFQQFVNQLLARTHLASIYERANEKERAAEQYRGIADDHLAHDRVPDALVALKDVVRLQPQDLGAREQMVKVLRGANRLGEASAAAVDLGRALLALNLPGRARNAFDLALKMVPGSLNVLWMLGGLLGKLGYTQDAVARYEEIARIAEEKGDQEAALAAYQQILDLDPAHPKARGVVRKLTGWKRAVFARAATAGAAGVLLLFVLGWSVYELRALAAYRATAKDAWAAIDEQKFEIARSALREFVRAWGLSRTASAATTLLDVVDAEEAAARELELAKLERAARELEAKGFLPRALDGWRRVAQSADPARKTAGAQGVARVESRLRKVQDALGQARAHEEQNVATALRQAHQLFFEFVPQAPWLEGSSDVQIPFLVESVPSGARVIVDGRREDRPTPVVVKRTLVPGKIRVEGRSAYLPVEREVSGVPAWPLVLVLPRKPLWLAEAPAFAGALAFAGDHVVAGGLDRTVAAFGRTTGEVRWRTSLGPFGECSAPPIVLEGSHVVVRANAGAVIGLDLATGRERWRRELEPPPPDPLDPVAGRPVAVLGGALVRVGGRGLVLLDAKGEPRWRATAPRELIGAPCLAGTLVVASSERTLLAWRAAKGEPAWTSPRLGLTVTGPVVGPGGTLYVGLEGGGIARVSPEGRLLGTEKQVVESIAAPIDASPARVLVGSQAGDVVALTEKDDGFRTIGEPGKPIRWVRSAGADLVLAGDVTTLYAWDGKGVELWRQPVQDGAPAIADDHRVYHGGANGVAALER